MSLPRGPIVPICIKINSFSKYRVHKSSNGRMNEEVENIMYPGSLAPVEA